MNRILSENGSDFSQDMTIYLKLNDDCHEHLEKKLDIARLPEEGLKKILR